MNIKNLKINSTDFSADCAVNQGKCNVTPESFVFYAKGYDEQAITDLKYKCGAVIVVPQRDVMTLYLTSCERMQSAVKELFGDDLGEFTEVTNSARSDEMSVATIYKISVRLSVEDVRVRVRALAE